MKSGSTTTALVFGATIALIAGLTGWTIREHIHHEAVSVPAPLALEGPNTPAFQNTLDPKRPPPSLEPSEHLAQSAKAMLLANNESVSRLVAAGTERLTSRYQRETIDLAWASGKQKALERANTSSMLEQSHAEPLSFDVQCRSTVCLIAANFSSPDAAEDWSNLYPMLAGPEMSNAAISRSLNPDGTMHLQIYGLARGEQL